MSQYAWVLEVRPGYEEEFGRSISLAILEAERASFE